MLEKIRITFFDNVKVLRSERGAKFLFLHKDIRLEHLTKLYLFEVLKKYREADDFLISKVIDKLIELKILKKNCTQYENFRLGKFLYHDVRLLTTDGGAYSRGTSTDVSEAFAKAIGEVLERSMMRYPTNDILEERKISTILSDKNFIDVNIMPKPSKEQLEKYENSKIGLEDIFSFIETTRLSDNKKIKVPAQNIYFGNFKKDKEKLFIQSTTHGAGAGYTPHQAFKSSLFEIIHRHFFLKNWYQNSIPKKVKLETIPKETVLYEKIQEFLNHGFQVQILDYTKEAKIPTHITFLEKDGIYCGGSTNLNALQSIERSLDEAFSIYWWCMQTNFQNRNKISKNKIDNVGTAFTSQYSDADYRVHIYGNTYFHKSANLDFLNGEEIEFTDMYDKSDVNLQKKALELFGANIFLYNKVNPILDIFDYHVSKVYIPNSYYFALRESDSRPVLTDKKEPINQQINPFP